MTYKLSAQAKRVVAQARITPEELEVMTSRAAVITHKDGNRRYHDWLLLILGDRLVKIRKLELTDYASGLASVEEECEDCDGDGCAHCGWAGVVKRLPL
jgi:hypothetical protein